MGIKGIDDANGRAQRAYEQQALPAQYLQNSYRFITIQAIQLLEALALNDESARNKRFQLIDTLEAPAQKQFELFRLSDKPDAAKPLAEDLTRDHALYTNAFSEAVQLLRKGNSAGANETMDRKVRPYGIALARDIEQLTALLIKSVELSHEQDTDAYLRTRRLMVGLMLTGGAVVGVCVWRQMRLIGRGLGGIQGTLREVSRSLDLTRRAPVERRDEIGLTASAFNSFIARIGEVIDTVHASTDAVSTAARQIAAGNLDLSARTEEQAVSLEETVSNMAQLTEMVRQNADHASRAKALATGTADVASSGNEAVQEMLVTMGKISASSGKISDITGLIEDIAFQTNILALNAAVEAARAGEQGRGFAVVASEVRSLAQRSSVAAKEIKDLIASSGAMVQDGSRQAEGVAGTISQVKDAIRQVSDVVGEIAFASEKQSHGLEQVNQSVNQIDKVTQQNAALVEQAAAAAQSLDEQAGNLRNVASVFKVADTSQSGSMPYGMEDIAPSVRA